MVDDVGAHAPDPSGPNGVRTATRART
jgi:hypothetical protein